MNPLDKLPGAVLRFGHQAMATDFEVYIAGEKVNDARHAASAAFEEIDRVENELSHYIGTSDVSRINRLGSGEETRVSAITLDCLKMAERMYRETGGAFDATVGSLLKGRRYWRDEDEGKAAPVIESQQVRVGMDLIELDARDAAVRVRDGRVDLDLGGIGKGFALDRAMEVLKEWDVEKALIHGGQSTFLPRGTLPQGGGWPMRLLDPRNEQDVLARYFLKGAAVSASAPGKKRHILDARTGRPSAARWTGTWSIAPTAAWADALSTAFMVMSVKEIKRYCRDHPRVCAIAVAGEGNKPVVKVFGDIQAYRFKWEIEL